MRDKSSTRCSQRLAEPGSALYGAPGMVRGRKRRRTTDVWSQLRSHAQLGSGVGRRKVVEKGMAVLHRCMQKGLRVAEGDFVYGYAQQGCTC